MCTSSRRLAVTWLSVALVGMLGGAEAGKPMFGKLRPRAWAAKESVATSTDTTPSTGSSSNITDGTTLTWSRVSMAVAGKVRRPPHHLAAHLAFQRRRPPTPLHRPSHRPPLTTPPHHPTTERREAGSTRDRGRG